MEERMKVKVPFYLCDKSSNLRLDGLLKILITASIENSEKVEGGPSKDIWVIYRWHLKFHKPIYWKDEIEIETASRKLKGFYAFRNFTVYRNGEKLVEADTKWLLLSSETHSLMRIPDELAEKYGQKPGYSFEGKEINKLDSYDHKKDIQIRKADIDLNGHVNNAVYLEFALEGLDFNIRDLDQMQIIYKNEVKYGDDIKLHYKSDDKNYYFKLTSGDKLNTVGQLAFK